MVGGLLTGVLSNLMQKILLQHTQSGCFDHLHDRCPTNDPSAWRKKQKRSRAFWGSFEAQQQQSTAKHSTCTHWPPKRHNNRHSDWKAGLTDQARCHTSVSKGQGRANEPHKKGKIMQHVPQELHVSVQTIATPIAGHQMRITAHTPGCDIVVDPQPLHSIAGHQTL